MNIFSSYSSVIDLRYTCLSEDVVQSQERTCAKIDGIVGISV
jgi:hypothetical protein